MSTQDDNDIERLQAEVDRLRADLAKVQGLIDFLNQPLPVNSRTALIERCYQVQLICETIPAHENQTKTALALSDLVDAIRKSGGRGETLADLQRARADAERAALWAAHLKLHLGELQRKVADFVRGASPAEWRHKEPRIVGFGLEFEEMKRFAALKDPEPPPAFLK